MAECSVLYLCYRLEATAPKSTDLFSPGRIVGQPAGIVFIKKEINN
jgi:hypothetical protein